MTRSATIVSMTLAVWGVTVVLQGLGAFETAELAFHDFQVRLAAVPHDETTRVAIIEIREADLDRWPISDRRLGAALEKLAPSGAAAIGVDLYRNLPVPPGESMLARVLADDPRIVGVSKFGDARSPGVPGHAVLARAGRVGFNDLLIGDPDERIRRGLLYQDDGKSEVETSFALRLAETALAARGIRPSPAPEEPAWLRLGETTIPPLTSGFGGYVDVDAAGYQFLIDFAHSSFARWPLSALESGALGPAELEDRVVILGSTAESLPDESPTPLGLLAGVTLHAHQIDQLLRFASGEATPMRSLSKISLALLTLLMSAAGCVVASGFRPDTSRAVLRNTAGAASAAALLGAATLGHRAEFWIPVVAPLFALVAGGGATAFWLTGRERAERKQLMNLFSRHVSSAVANQVWERRSEFMDRGRPRPQRLYATVLFLDMVGSTAKVEQLEPETLMLWTNRFMEVMAREVALAGGVVDDYFGDGLKACFGVPIPRQDPAEFRADARSAIGSALAMRSRLGELNRQYKTERLPLTAMRIGIHSGRVVAGSIGTADRLKYTVMGDVVVSAARLEQTPDVEHDFEREPCRILLSRHCVDLASRAYETQDLGLIALAGRRERLAALSLVGPGEQAL